MGAANSVPTEIDRKYVQDATSSTRDIMNILLEYMIKELSVRDFYLLSNPSECKKYVLFMANTLYRQFYELNIAPVKDKKGTLVFRSVKDLVNPSESDKLERQSLCLILSYFYARIFQILGALALTLIDDSTSMSERGLIRDDIKKLYAPGTQQYVYKKGGSSVLTSALGSTIGTVLGSAIIGGKRVDLGVYNFMADFLSFDESAKSSTYGYRTKSPDYVSFFSPIKSDKYSVTYSGVISVAYKNTKKIFFIDISAKSLSVDDSSIELTFNKIRYPKKGITRTDINDKINTISRAIPLPTLKKNSFIIDSEVIDKNSGKKRYFVRNEDFVNISEFMQYALTKITPFANAYIAENTDFIVNENKGTKVATGETSSKDINEELRLERTIYNLLQQKPLGHCIARAMQLLKTVPLDSESSGLSSICKIKFLEVKEGITRSGLPVPGLSLDSSPGLAALSQLFYDTIELGMPKIKMSATSLSKYTQFMKSLSTLYGDTKDTINFGKESIKTIKNKRDREICGTIIGDISIAKEDVPKVYKFVKELYKKQVEHSAKAGKIFSMLFNIQNDKMSKSGGPNKFRIALSDNILKLGIPEINRINDLTRDVLIDYYKGCETTYLYGVQEVFNSLKKKEQQLLQ